MKAKDYIIIGGAVALFLLWKNKNKKVGTSSTTTGGYEGATTTAVKTGGYAMPKQSTAGTSQVTSFPTPSNEPEQINGLGLPTGMDLPVLTAGTGIPTEVAIQEGGVLTAPEPIIVHAPPLQIEEALELGGIKPIKKPQIAIFPIANAEISDIVVMPREKPTLLVDTF
jgi:hypothetical protein